MAEPHQSDNRPRSQGGRNRRSQSQRRDGDDRPRTEHDTYRRNGEATEYSPPRDQRKTFGGGEYERVYRDKSVTKKPLWQKILSILSLGLLGKDKPAAKPAAPAPRSRSAGGRPARDRDDRDGQRGGPSRRSGGGERSERSERSDRPERSREPRSNQPRRSEEGAETPRRPSIPRETTERAPQPVDLEAITTPRLHVGNLSYDTVESDLFEHFNGVGKVTNCEIVTHSRTQRSKGFGFVQFATTEEAKRAASELHGKPFMGRMLIVGPAKGPKPERFQDRDRSERDDHDSEEIRPTPLTVD